MDKPLPDDFDAALRGDADGMNINNMDIPRSTIVVGLALWGVLVALGAWNLSVTSDVRVEQRGQSRELAAVNARVDRVEKDVERNSQDIRELQRTGK